MSIAHGHLHLFKRHPSVEAAYHAWKCEKIKAYGLMRDFILNEKLGWRILDTDPGEIVTMGTEDAMSLRESDGDGRNRRFRAKGKPEDLKVLANDWPYSIPAGKASGLPRIRECKEDLTTSEADVTHYVVWSKRPILHPLLVPAHFPSVVRSRVWEHIRNKGLYGITGTMLPSLSSKASLKRREAIEEGLFYPTPPSSRGEELTAAEVEAQVPWALLSAKRELEAFVEETWPEDAFETAFCEYVFCLSFVHGLV
jgi:Protein of unknown function (DUF3605)